MNWFYLPIIFCLAGSFQPMSEKDDLWYLEHYNGDGLYFTIENEKDDLWYLENYEPEEEKEERRRSEELQMLAQLVQAEAGNQDLKGMRLVADVVLNRIDSNKFPDTMEEVIFQDEPTQFTVTKNGSFEKAHGRISENAFLAAEMEWKDRLNWDVLYFRSDHAPNRKHVFKHGDHWFGW